MKKNHKKVFSIRKLGRALPVLGLSAIMTVQADLTIDNSYGLILKHLPAAYSSEALSFTDMSMKENLEHPEIILTPRQKREILLEAMSNQAGDNTNTVLTHHAVKDLKLLSGTTLRPERSLLNNIGKPETVAGEIMLANTLITPTADIPTLEQRQEALKYLLNNPALCQELTSLLHKYAQDEDGIIALFDPSDVINTHRSKEIEKETQSIFPISSSSGFEASRRLGEAATVLTLLAATPVGIGTSISVQLFWVAWGVYEDAWRAFKFLPVGWSIVSRRAWNQFSANSLPLQVAMVGGIAALQGLCAYQAYQIARTQKGAYSFIMERSRRPGRVLSAAEKIATTLNKHPTLVSALNSYQGFDTFKNSPQIKKATSLLANAPDQTPGAFAYFLSSMGHYKQSLNLLRQNKEQLLAITQAAGEIDAWLTVTKLVRENQKTEGNKLTFAKFEASDSPVLHLENYWNPHLSSDTAVPSTVKMGENNHPRNMLVTGPNAAGKSTAIEGIAISSILAQTFGIAPAEEFSLTPFSLIHTHMDISAEVAAGLSSFKAESVRAIELMSHVQNLAPGQFSLAVMDEIFSSTNPTEGEAGTYGYLKTLGKYPQTINISTSHYPRPMLLAKKHPENFQNMHVDATTEQDGSLKYDYHLKPGYSVQQVAIQLLKEQGIESDFLDTATDIIAHPEMYEVSPQ